MQLVEPHGDNTVRPIDRDHRASVFNDLPEDQLHLFGSAGILVHAHADRDALLSHGILLYDQGILDSVLAEHSELDDACATGAETDRHGAFWGFVWKKRYGITIADRYTRKFITLVLRIPFRSFFFPSSIVSNSTSEEKREILNSFAP